jgi:hypothetical protein
MRDTVYTLSELADEAAIADRWSRWPLPCSPMCRATA